MTQALVVPVLLGKFVTEYMGLDQDHFYKVNDGLHPNCHVYGTLRDKAGMNPYLDNFDEERFGLE